MFMDINLQFSDKQAITATAASTNLVDLGIARNIGVGDDLYLVLLVTTAFTDSGSDSTVTPSLETATDAAFTSPVTVATYDVFAALAAVGASQIHKLKVGTAAGAYLRYIRVKYTLANGNLTTGAITSFIVKDTTTWLAYAGNFTVA